MHQLNIIKNRRRVVLLSAAFLWVLIIGTSCKKEISPLGKGVLDQDELLLPGGTTLSVTTFSEADNLIPTDNQLFALLGAYNDPKMGTFNASFYTQVLPTGTLSFAPTDVIRIDSMVLALEYGGYYGNLTPQTVEVYRLADTLDINTTYYRNSTKQLSGGNIVDPNWSATITPKPTQKVVVGGDTVPAQLRIHLDTLVAASILHDIQLNNTPILSNAAFIQYFKGLHVKMSNPTPASGTGGVLYFKTNVQRSKMTIYYHLNNAPTKSQYDFSINNLCADFNHVDIDNTGYDVENVINNPVNNDMKQFYAQAFKTRGGVRFPGIDDLPANCIVHGAVLVLPIAYQSGTTYYPSADLRVGYKQNGTIIGFQTTTYDAESKFYTVDIRDYVQSVVLGDVANTGLYFYPSFMGGTAERIVFNGPNTTNKDKPRLIIKYTEY